jgi:hypothetical protein
MAGPEPPDLMNPVAATGTGRPSLRENTSATNSGTGDRGHTPDSQWATEERPYRNVIPASAPAILIARANASPVQLASAISSRSVVLGTRRDTTAPHFWHMHVHRNCRVST